MQIQGFLPSSMLVNEELFSRKVYLFQKFRNTKINNALNSVLHESNKAANKSIKLHCPSTDGFSPQFMTLNFCFRSNVLVQKKLHLKPIWKMALKNRILTSIESVFNNWKDPHFKVTAFDKKKQMLHITIFLTGEAFCCVLL